MSKATLTTEFSTINKAEIFEIQNTVKHLNWKIEADKAKLEEDFSYFFAWRGEDLFKNAYKAKEFGHILKALEDDYSHHVLSTRIEQLQNAALRSYNVRVDSTGALHREASTWMFQCNLEILEFLKNLLSN